MTVMFHFMPLVVFVRFAAVAPTGPVLGHEPVEFGLVLRHPQPQEKFVKLALLRLHLAQRRDLVFVKGLAAACSRLTPPVLRLTGCVFAPVVEAKSTAPHFFT